MTAARCSKRDMGRDGFCFHDALERFGLGGSEEGVRRRR